MLHRILLTIALLGALLTGCVAPPPGAGDSTGASSAAPANDGKMTVFGA